MKRIKKTLKEKIIIATIECIERKGIHLVTIRDIARQAKVNIASVNYYFGTKEKLFEETLKFSIYNTLAENIEEIEKAHRDAYSMIKALFNDIFQGALRYPNLLKAHFYGPIVNNDYSGLSVEWLNDFAGTLADKIEKLGLPVSDKKKIKYALVQMMSAIILCSLAPNLFDKFSGIDFRDPGTQEEYVDRLIEQYLGTTGTKRNNE